jgi:hypothetical protein
MATTLGQKCRNVEHGTYLFESEWHILINVMTRWKYIYAGIILGKPPTSESWFCSGTKSKEETKSTIKNHLYQLLKTFKVVPEDAYSLLPMMGKVNTTGTT